jgi:RND family efflux transporter MFP subunit
VTAANLTAETEPHVASTGRPVDVRPRRRVLPVLFTLVVIGSTLGGLYYAGMAPRREARAALHAETAAAIASRPRVNFVTPYRRSKPSDLTLPGEIRAFQDTEIFARTDGYLERYLVDIGDEVEAGALLAEIDTPELDEELKQAQATLEQSRANRELAASRLDLARITLRRSQMLLARGVETQQVFDENNAQYKVAEATLSTAEADIAAKAASVSRLAELQKFQKVYAPYRGVITARNVDTGELISATMSRPMFRIAQTDNLKVYVNVPQANATAIAIGQGAEVLVRERPEHPFVGKVSRTAGAIETSSRTLLTEILLPNPEGKLYAGMYVKVRFAEAGGRPLLIPATTLVINAQGTRVATVGPDDALRYKEVHLGRDYGQEVEVLNGLDGDERLILNPTENLVDGVKVEATAAPAA